METITQFRLPNGEVMRLVDWVDKPLFSTLELLTGFGDRRIDCFTYNVGEPVPATANATVRRISTERDTNVDVGGAQASTEELLIYAIKPEYFELQNAGGTPTDMTTAAARLVGQPMPRTNVLAQLHMTFKLRLIISQKAYADAGLGWFNSGFGPYGAGAAVPGTAAASGRTYATAGLPSQEAVRTFAVPHHIGGTEKYRLELINPAADTVNFQDETTAAPVTIAQSVMRMRFYLDGMKKRPTA